jgi:hypothetical protein
MPTQKTITITNLSGVEPYVVNLCDENYNGCVYIDLIYDYDIEYTFSVPSSFLNLTTLGVKLVDSNGCQIKNTISL